MSNFAALTRHPETKDYRMATWMDNYFGRRRYGVRFDGEDRVFDPDKVEMPTVAEAGWPPDGISSETFIRETRAAWPDRQSEAEGGGNG